MTLTVNISTNVYALSEHDHEGLPWPMPADTWLWQSGDRWLAHVGSWYTDDWWEGADPDDIAARPERWARHILDVPTTGTLVFNDGEGTTVTMPASAPEAPNWTIEVGGDDSWDTMRRVMDALAGWHVEIDGLRYEILGADDSLLVQLINEDGTKASDAETRIDPSILPTVRVL